MAIPTAGLFGLYEARLETGVANLAPVDVFTDQSGAGRNLTPLTSERRPEYRTGVVDGHAALRFAEIGTRDFLRIDFASVSATAWSQTVVLSSGAAESTTRKWIIYAGNDTTNIMSLTEGVTAGEYGTFGRTTPTVTVQQSTSGVDTRTWCVLTMVWNGSTLVLYRNGTQVASTALGGSFAFTTLSVGSIETDASAALRDEAFEGDIALAGFWNVALDATARSQLHSYVQDTYPTITVSDYSGGGPAPTPGTMTAAVAPLTVTTAVGSITGTDPGAAAGNATMTPSAVAYGDAGWGDGGWGGDPTPLIRTLSQDGGMVGLSLPDSGGTGTDAAYVIVAGQRKTVTASYAIVGGARKTATLNRG